MKEKKIDPKNDIWINKFDPVILARNVRVPLIVIYDHPTDYPAKYVARLWDLKGRPTRFVMLKDDITEIRKAIPSHMIKIPRFREDDEKIVETWI